MIVSCAWRGSDQGKRSIFIGGQISASLFRIYINLKKTRFRVTFKYTKLRLLPKNTTKNCFKKLLENDEVPVLAKCHYQTKENVGYSL